MRAVTLLAALAALAATHARPMFLPNLDSRTRPPVANSDTGFVPRAPHDARADADAPGATPTLEKTQALAVNKPPSDADQPAAAPTLEKTQALDAQVLTVEINDAWSLDTTYDGNNFGEDNWWWFTDDDPTYGHVNYVNYGVSQGKSLSWAQGGKFGIAVDNKTEGKQNERGRDSVRIQTRKGFGQSIMVFDVEHMPVGCGTFPALWTIGQGQDWPNGGEVDIIEGSNNDWGPDPKGSPGRANLITLHTNKEPGLETEQKCRMAEDWGKDKEAKDQEAFSGTAMTKSCSASNGGCNVQPNDEYAYGNKFNENGGGWYVVRRNADSFAFWFFRRDANNVPASIKDGGQSVSDADLEGVTKVAEFGAKILCENPGFMERFSKQEIIINISLGGKGNTNWGASDFNADQSCHQDKWKGNVEGFIDATPHAYDEAYWLFNSIRIYTNGKED